MAEAAETVFFVSSHPGRGKAEYNFWLAALKVLADAGHWDQGVGGKFRSLVEKHQGKLPPEAWKDLFPNRRHMHSYTGALKGIVELLRTKRFPEELVHYVDNVIQEREDEARMKRLNRGHQAALNVWREVRSRLEKAQGPRG